METGGRMTRSRAKALGATPAPQEPKTAGKTGGRTSGRRKAAAQTPEQKPVEQKQLDFCEDVSPRETATEISPDIALEVQSSVIASPVTPSKATSQPVDEAEVLMASPVIIRSEQPSAATAVLGMATTPQALITANEGLDGVPEPPQQFPLFAVAQQAPMLTPSPLPAGFSPQPVPSSPFGMDFNQDVLAASPLPAGIEGSPLPNAANPLGMDFAQDVAVPSPAHDASPLPASTPLSFTMPYDAFAQPAPSPAPASIPATPLTAAAHEETDAMAAAIEAAEFSPMPDDDDDDGSPISLSGEPMLTPAPAQYQAQADEDDQMVDDEPMADGTPLTFVSDRRATPRSIAPQQSPMAGFFVAPGSVPHSAAAVGNASRQCNAAGFQGFAAMPPTPGAGSEPCVESPSLEGLISTAVTSSIYNPPLSPVVQSGGIATPKPAVQAAVLPIASPLEDAGLPPAPASTPEVGPLPTWTLAQTPLNRGIADAVQATAEDIAMESTSADAAETAEAMEQELVQPTGMVADMIQTPIAQQPSSKSVSSGRGPLPGSALRAKTPGTKATANKLTPILKTATPGVAGTAKAISPYVHVESRYKTPNTGAAASKSLADQPPTASKATPIAPTNAAAGAKSIKRVSIHTPEGPRSIAPLRQVVPTPYRPALIIRSQSPVEPAAPAIVPSDVADKESIPNEVSAVAEQRRSQAADRLKSIHATEQGSASTPGYLQPTQAFAVKTAKAVKSKVDAGSYDPRSLRQLKREIKDVVAKKKAKDLTVSDVRSSKLTPNVNETQLPMPDDDDDSKEAEYNEAQENELVEAMGGLEVAPPKNNAPLPLRGLPAPKGRHLRFNDTGAATESPQRVVLRGLPVASGKYKRFE